MTRVIAAGLALALALAAGSAGAAAPGSPPRPARPPAVAPAQAQDYLDILHVMGPPASLLPSKCSGEDCTALMYPSNRGNPIMLVVFLRVDGTYLAARLVTLGESGEPTAVKDVTTIFREHVRNVLATRDL